MISVKYLEFAVGAVVFELIIVNIVVRRIVVFTNYHAILTIGMNCGLNYMYRSTIGAVYSESHVFTYKYGKIQYIMFLVPCLVIYSIS